MPALVSHMIAACRAGERLAPHGLDADNGEFLLGATTPDIRVITRWERERTHFFDITDERHQDSVAAFFEAHRGLRDTARLSPQTRSWVCGYLTHLIMDQEYVTAIYRPYFGRRSLLGGNDHANLLDRILQYEFDRRERERGETMQHMRRALFASALEIDAGFIDHATLEQWRDTTAAVTEHPPDWERFTFIASRHLNRAGIADAQGLNEFMERVPELLDQTLNHVDQATLDAFFELTAERTAQALGEWLGDAA